MSKVFMVANCKQIGQSADVTPVTEVYVDALAALMVDAYKGTVDWEEGDSADVAKSEIQAALDGKYGTFLPNASGVVLNELGNPVSALITTQLEGKATILFVYTAKSAASRDLASMLIRNAAYQLQESGEDEVALFVTTTNPARKLYESLGFVAV